MDIVTTMQWDFFFFQNGHKIRGKRGHFETFLSGCGFSYYVMCATQCTHEEKNERKFKYVCVCTRV